MSLSRPDHRLPVKTCAVLLFLLVLLVLPSRAGAEENPGRVINPQALFYQANSLYEEGRYEEAAAAYRQLLDHGDDSGSLSFILGNTYFRMGRTGWAVLYYEKAKRLIPRDADLRANLGYALEGVDEGTPSWQREFYQNLVNFFPQGHLVLMTSFFFALLIAIIIVMLLANGHRTSPLRPCCAISVAGTILPLRFSFPSLLDPGRAPVF